MNKMIQKAIISIIVALFTYSFTYALTQKQASSELQTFYKNPSYTKLISILNAAYSKTLSKNAELPLTAFVTMVFNKHPTYAEQASKKLSTYSPKVREKLSTSLSAIKGTGLTPNDINTLSINDKAVKLDILWSAYFATGESVYLKKLLEYTSHNPYLLLSAFKIHYLCRKIQYNQSERKKCRNKVMKKVFEEVSKQYPNHSKKMIYKLAVVYAALWSLESNRKQDPEIDQKIKQLIQTNPKLDYRQNIIDEVKRLKSTTKKGSDPESLNPTVLNTQVIRTRLLQLKFN